MPKTIKRDDHGKRFPLNMRTTQEIRDALESAAAASGRSLAQEVEYRLERSFDRQSLLPEVLELAFTARFAGVLMLIARHGEAVGVSACDIQPGIDPYEAWLDQPFAYRHACQAIAAALEAVRPEGKADSADEADEQQMLAIANEGQEIIAKAIIGIEAPTPELAKWGKQVRELLGEKLVNALSESLQHAR